MANLKINFNRLHNSALNPTRALVRRTAWAVYDVFETEDGGQIFVGVVSDKQWTQLGGLGGCRYAPANSSLRRWQAQLRYASTVNGVDLPRDKCSNIGCQKSNQRCDLSHGDVDCQFIIDNYTA